MLVRDYLEKGRSLAERIPYSFIALASRIAVADVFWCSGQTKVNGFSIREETFYLFREEYKVPLLPPDLAAYLSTIGEHVFPILLLVGLASRLSALGLFGMTMVIQLFVVPGGWPEHILWLSLLTPIIARGPGSISLDHLIWTGRIPVPASPAPDNFEFSKAAGSTSGGFSLVDVRPLSDRENNGNSVQSHAGAW